MRFLVFIFAFLLIIGIFFISDKILRKRAKFCIVASALLCITAAYFYENFIENSSIKKGVLVSKFNAGKTLKCRGEAVDNKNFTYSFPLNAFIAKKDAIDEIKGKIYNIKECDYDE